MYRKGVSALIINKNKEFILVNLTSFEEKFFAIPGGGIEKGENLEEAAYREIQEELGIKPTSLELVGRAKRPLCVTFKTPKVNNEGKEYLGSERNFFGFKFNGEDEEIKLAENEVRAYKWVPFSELYKYLLFDHQLEETSSKILELFPQFK